MCAGRKGAIIDSQEFVAPVRDRRLEGSGPSDLGSGLSRRRQNRAKIRHLANPKIRQVADAAGVFVVYTGGRPAKRNPTGNVLNFNLQAVTFRYFERYIG